MDFSVPFRPVQAAPCVSSEQCVKSCHKAPFDQLWLLLAASGGQEKGFQPVMSEGISCFPGKTTENS